MLSSRHTRALGAALLTAVTACGGGEEPSARAASIALTGSSGITAIAGQPVSVTVAVSDAQGRTLAGAPVQFQPSSGTAVPASATTSSAGISSTAWTVGTKAGAQSITVTSGVATATFNATVAADRAATVTVQRTDAGTITAGGTATLAASAADRYANPVTGTPAWSTSNNAVATVDATGKVSALQPGTATITAVVDTARGQTTITVAPSVAVTITSVDADTLAPGRTITITGTGFAPNAMGVIVGGVPATITSATTTQIVARVAAASSYGCSAPAPAILAVRRVVASESTFVTRTLPLDVTTHVALAVGERAIAAEQSGAGCVRLDRGGNYVVALYNANTTVPGGIAAQVRGTGATILAARAARTPMPRAVVLPHRDSTADEHTAHLARERARIARLGARVAAATAPRTLRAVAVPATGDVVTLNAMYFDCAVPTPVQARVAAVGTRSVVLEDVKATTNGANDALYRQIATEFDQVDYPLITQHFGDPLALDASFGGDGRVRILFTPYVADSVPNTVGFMTGCNFYRKAQLPASNEGAVFYARLQKANETSAEWLYNLRPTIVHETKHLAAYAERFARAGSGTPVLEETWLEEATARVAEELYARTFSGATWKGNATYAPTVGCELTRCDARPLGVYRHFEAVADFYSRVDSLTPLGGVSRFDQTFYGSGWLLVRWAADRFATDEPSFFRALTTETTALGLANLARRTGRAADAMLPDWALALAVDDRPGFTPSISELRVASWNTRDIFRGLNAYSPFQFKTPFPLLERSVTGGDFTVDVPLLRSYTSAFIELTSAPVGQLLSARAPNAAVVPPGIGLAIVRVP